MVDAQVATEEQWQQLGWTSGVGNDVSSLNTAGMCQNSSSSGSGGNCCSGSGGSISKSMQLSEATKAHKYLAQLLEEGRVSRDEYTYSALSINRQNRTYFPLERIQSTKVQFIGFYGRYKVLWGSIIDQVAITGRGCIEFFNM